MNWNLLLLTLAQAMLVSAHGIIFTVAALVGRKLTDDPAWATLPLGLIFLTVTVFTLTSSRLMGAYGRRAGFVAGALFGIAGALLGVTAIVRESFVLFCLTAIVIGMSTSFGQFYRFAAVEVVSKRNKSKAISWVLAGGILAALIGPNLVRWVETRFELTDYVGSYLALTGIYCIMLMLVIAMRFKRSDLTPTQQPINKRQLMTQPVFITAVVCGALSYAVMSSLMTATPLSMQHYGHTLDRSAIVIQWHMLGMFVPALFTGQLINWLGRLVVMVIGILMMAISIVINFSGTDLSHFYIALTLLGVGWNFLFIGSTDLLTSSYTTENKSYAQGVNDTVISAVAAFSMLVTGSVFSAIGWQWMNLVSLPLLLSALLLLGWCHLRSNAAPTAL